MINTDNVPRQVITTVNYSFELFSALLHPPAAEFVCALQAATPTQVAIVIECDDCCISLYASAFKYCECDLYSGTPSI